MSEKNEILLFAAILMNPESIMLTEVSQRQTQYDVTYTWSVKVIQRIYMQNKSRLTDIENKFTATKGGSRGRNKLEI